MPARCRDGSNPYLNMAGRYYRVLKSRGHYYSQACEHLVAVDASGPGGTQKGSESVLEVLPRGCQLSCQHQGSYYLFISHIHAGNNLIDQDPAHYNIYTVRCFRLHACIIWQGKGLLGFICMLYGIPSSGELRRVHTTATLTTVLRAGTIPPHTHDHGALTGG
jgi:hypothetical protein